MIDPTSDKKYYGYPASDTHAIHTQEWRPIPTWPYEISNLGRIRRTGRATGATIGREMKPGLANGYSIVVLSDASTGRHHTFNLHKLVAQSFLGPCPEGYQVHHKDHDRTNASASNLEYVTRRQNILHSVANGHHGTSRWNAVLTIDKVHSIKEMRHAGYKVKTIAQQIGCSESAVYHVLRGSNWRHIG